MFLINDEYFVLNISWSWFMIDNFCNFFVFGKTKGGILHVKYFILPKMSL